MNTVVRVKTRIWVLQVELRSNFDETDAEFRHEESVALSTALPGLVLVGSLVVKISSFSSAAIFSKKKLSELQDVISLNNVNIVFMTCNGPLFSRKILKKPGM